MIPSSALLYKAWLESRTRFLFGAGIVGGLCLAFLLFRDLLGASTRALSYSNYVYLRVYGGFVRGLFLFFTLVLGLGGLNGERARHTIAFTLSLPISRFQLVAARAVVGLGEVTALAAIPAVLIPLLSALCGEPYTFVQCLPFFVLWTTVGGCVFSAAFLASAIFKNEFTALFASILSFYAYPLIVARTDALRRFPLHIHYLMNGTGMSYVNPASHTFAGPLPWGIITGVSLVALSFFAIATRLCQVDDFS